MGRVPDGTNPSGVLQLRSAGDHAGKPADITLRLANAGDRSSLGLQPHKPTGEERFRCVNPVPLSNKYRSV